MERNTVAFAVRTLVTVLSKACKILAALGDRPRRSDRDLTIRRQPLSPLNLKLRNRRALRTKNQVEQSGSSLPTKPKVVLFYPPYAGPPLGAPLALLS